MAASLGDVLLQRVIDAEPVRPLDHERWPRLWPEQRAKDPPLAVRLQRVPKHGASFLGRELDGLNRYVATPATGYGRLACGPKVPHPAGLAIGRLDEPATVNLDQADRDRSQLA